MQHSEYDSKIDEISCSENVIVWKRIVHFINDVTPLHSVCVY